MAEFKTFKPEQLKPWPGLNSRRRFNEDVHQQLVASVTRNGVLQPLVVALQDQEPHFIVAGERRWRAAKEAGKVVPAMVSKIAFKDALELVLVENLERESLTPIEEALGFVKLRDEGKLTEKKIATLIKRDPSYVSNRIRLLDLPADIQELIESGRLAATYARDLLVPWTREDAKIAAHFFRVLTQFIGLQKDLNEPISKQWLTESTDRIAAVVKPKGAAKKSADRRKAKKPEPRVSKPAAPEPEEQVAERLDGLREKLEPSTMPGSVGYAASTQPAPEISPESPETSGETPEDPEITGNVPGQSPATPAAPAAAALGVFDALLPYLDEWTFTIGVSRVREGSVNVTVAPNRVHGLEGPAVTPLLLKGAPEMIAQHLEATLPAWLEARMPLKQSAA